MRKKRSAKQKSVFEKFLKVEHTLPMGIRVLTVYLFLLAIFYAVVGLVFGRAMVFGLFFDKISAFFINLITISLILALIYGFAKKKITYYYISLAFFSLIIINTLVSIFSIRLFTDGILYSIVNYSFYMVLAVNVMTLAFILSKKYYFEHPKPEYHVKKADKMFVTGIVIVWVLLMGGILYMGDQYLEKSFVQADEYIDDLYDMGVLYSMNYCDKQENKDLCYLVAAEINKEDNNSKLLCERIQIPYLERKCLA